MTLPITTTIWIIIHHSGNLSRYLDSNGWHIVLLDFLPALTVMLFPIIATPGPANLSFFAIGCAGGVSRSLPFLLGVNTAVLLVALVVFFGGGSIIKAPWFPNNVLRYLGLAYLVYLGWTFFRIKEPEAVEVAAVPGFRSGFFLQIVNPKLYSLILLVLSQVPELGYGSLAILSFYFLCINVAPHIVYLSMGHFGGGLGSARKRNVASAWMLWGVALWMLLEAT